MKKMVAVGIAKKVSVFVGGMIAGSLTNKVVSCPCVKKAAVHITATTLKAKDIVLDTVTKVQENIEDVISEAKEINETKEKLEEAELDSAE